MTINFEVSPLILQMKFKNKFIIDNPFLSLCETIVINEQECESISYRIATLKCRFHKTLIKETERILMYRYICH